MNSKNNNSKDKLRDRKYQQCMHFNKRMFERFGVQITKKDIDDLFNQVLSRKSILIEKKGNRFIHSVKFKNEYLIVVFDQKTDSFVTVLPKTSKYFKKLEIKLLQIKKNNLLNEMKKLRDASILIQKTTLNF